MEKTRGGVTPSSTTSPSRIPTAIPDQESGHGCILTSLCLSGFWGEILSGHRVTALIFNQPRGKKERLVNAPRHPLVTTLFFPFISLFHLNF